MGIRFGWKVDRLYNKGFTMIEALIVMVFVVLVSGLFYIPTAEFKAPLSIGVLDDQLEAMATGQRVYFMEGLWFNGRGNINRGQTLNYRGVVCVFQLGMGRYRCGS